MSAEAEVSGGLEKPVDQNAQSAAETEKLLTELQGDADTKATANDRIEKNANGASKEEDKGNGGAADRFPDRRRNDRDRSDRDRDGHRGRDRGGRRGSRFGGRNYKDNIKSDLTAQEESSDPVAIRKQVEFYFSDGNLPYDEFLLSAVGGSKNKPVEIATLHSFKRMRHFQPFSAIVDAMRESTFVELCEDDTCVRRREPLPAELDNGPDPNAIRIFEDRAMPRSIYAKGFGDEAPSTQFDIERFFARYGSTNAVRLRRSEDMLFKGSVFVEFETEELASAFLALDPKPKYDDKELQIMSKKEYCDKKVEDIKAGKIKANTMHDRPYGRGEGRGDRRGGHRDRDGDRYKRKREDGDDRDWRVRRNEDRKNGFRDDKRRDRDGDRKYKYDSKVERDDSGIPTVKTSDPPSSKRDTAKDKAEAIAKAKVIVEEQNRKIAELERGVEADTNGNGVEGESKKRAREESEGDAEREAKKVDTKTEVEAAS